MTKTREQKKEIIKNLSDKINQAKTIIFTNYQGLKVGEMTDLRKKLKKEKADFQAVKNSLVKLSFSKSKNKEIKSKIFDLKGGKAVVFGYEDEMTPAKILYLFSRQHKALKILGGILDGKELAKTEIVSLALLPSRQEILAKVAGSIGAPISGFVNALTGNLRNLIYILQAINKK
ncbi:MAG: 50S ribosomal protein L10 [Patescibacteria group bacterium]